MTTAIVNRHGQVTLPAKNRKEVGLTPGTTVSISFADGVRTIMPQKEYTLDDFVGVLPVSDRTFTDTQIQDVISEDVTASYLS